MLVDVAASNPCDWPASDALIPNLRRDPAALIAHLRTDGASAQLWVGPLTASALAAAASDPSRTLTTKRPTDCWSGV